MSEKRLGTPSPDIWNVPHYLVRYYVTRAQEEQTIMDKLATEGTVTIGGKHGIGKTLLATAIAYHQQDNYEGIIWVDLAKGIQESCAKVVKSQSLPGESPIHEIDDLFKERGGKRLWIIDGAPQIPVEFTPDSNRHVLIVDERIQTPDVMIEPFTEEQGAEVVLRRAGYLDETHIEEVWPLALNCARNLSATFGGNPDYLVRAGKYIEDTDCGVPDFLNLLQGEDGHRLMQILEQMG